MAFLKEKNVDAKHEVFTLIGLIVLSTTLASIVFFIDVLLPLGVAGGVPYMVVVMSSWWYKNFKVTIYSIAGVCSVLTVLGFFLSPEGSILWVVIVNRIYAVFAIWITAISLILAKSSMIALEKQALELKKLYNVTQQIPISVVVTDVNGNIEFTNPYFSTLTGYSPKEVIGKNPRILSSELTPKSIYKELWGTIRSGKIWRGEFCNKKKNGELYWESSTISPINDIRGKIINYVAVKSDITEQKNFEDSLKKAKSKAEKSERAKSIFLAVMSHEIRTPLNGIIGMAEILLDTFTDKRYKDKVVTIVNSGKILKDTINSILDFSKIESEKIVLENIDFSLFDLINIRTDLFGKIAEQKGLQYVVNIDDNLPDYFNGPSHHLGQILNNLISNAIKFTEQGTVTVSVAWVGEKEGSMIEFIIQDSGIGIDTDKLQQIFEPFTQADNSITRRFGGTGLGLAISQKLVSLMGGNIRVDSSLGHGSTFTVQVVLKKINQTNTFHTEKSKKNFTEPFPVRFRLLLVEDDLINQKVFLGMISKMNLEVTVANRGELALEYLEQESFDLVLMDCNLPGISGYKTCETFREYEKNTGKPQRTPVVAITALATAEDRASCLAHGMDDHISKPIDVQQFYFTLRRWLPNKRP